MAKKGKKGKGKKKKLTEDDPNALTEVDKTFYELTISDLNRKLARLRSLTQELEQKNEELVQQSNKQDEDKSDVITYLKRMLQEKTNEINELEERITGLQEVRQNETEQFQVKIADLEQEYKQMHEQLTSENKLLDERDVLLLGVTLGSNMSWHDHAVGIVKTASQKLGTLIRTKKLYAPHQVLMLYKPQIRPSMEYCSHIWSSASKHTLNLLDSIQRRTVRLIDDPALSKDLESLAKSLVKGKLNSLEEFRSQRDDLMKRFESQEKQMEAQEKRHTREMYEIERKFIISKDKLKKDMEARLLQLSTEFHDASELRIAATTHRVIRENIAVNNELDAMLLTHQKMYRDYQLLKSRDTTLKQEANLHEVEKKKALSKARVQKKIIQRITAQNEYVKSDLNRFKNYESEVRDAREQIKKGLDEKKQMEFKIRLLEQNLHQIKCQNTTLQTEILYLKDENYRLDDILMEGVSCIKEALTIKSESDTSVKSSKRESLLNTLFVLLSKSHERKIKRPSLETVPSAEATYAVGDLGFVPKPIIEPRPYAPTTRNITSQTGTSFDEFLKFGDVKPYFVKKSYADKNDSELDITSEEGEENVEEEEILEEEKKSVLFFDDEEVAEEETEAGSKEFDPFAGPEEESEISLPEETGRKLSKRGTRESLKKDSLAETKIKESASEIARKASVGQKPPEKQPSETVTPADEDPTEKSLKEDPSEETRLDQIKEEPKNDE